MALQDRTGQKVPSVVFRTRVGDTWKDVSTDDLFKGKKVVVFSLPGAFTPTCSSSHLPRYNELFGAFKENGVDAIYCVSVNDTFVMNAWAAEEEADNIYMIPDGNGEFTEAWACWLAKKTWASANALGVTPCWLTTAWLKKCLSNLKNQAILSKCLTLTLC